MKIIKNDAFEVKGLWNAVLNIQDSQGFQTSVEINGLSSREEVEAILKKKEAEIMEKNDLKEFRMP
jgi:hypothetical protein